MAALGNDSWLDRLDIPEMPDFADPTFNPYVYDGADNWFTTHRETYTRSQMAVVSSQEDTKLGNFSQAEISIQELPPRSHSSRSHQENTIRDSGATHNSGGDSGAPCEDGNAPPKRSRAPFMTVKPNRTRPFVARKTVAFHTVAKSSHIARPLHTTHTEAPKTTIKQRPPPPNAPPATVKRSIIPTRLPPPPTTTNTKNNNNDKKQPHNTEHCRPPHLPPFNKSHTEGAHRAPTVTVNPLAQYRPSSTVSLNRRRSDEVDAAGQKRRSVVAARAGEYFAHILRAYPTESVKGKTVPGWK